MEITQENLSEIFSEFIEKDKNYLEALGVVSMNSTRNIWLIGGTVYGNLVGILDDKPRYKPKDYDFIVEDANQGIKVPESWTKERNSFGNWKFKKGKIVADFIPLNNIDLIKKRNLSPRIENYLSGTFLNIQSIAYDLYEKKIIGEKGIEAIATRTVKVNNVGLAGYCAKKYGKTINGEIERVANLLGFKAELVDFNRI